MFTHILEKEPLILAKDREIKELKRELYSLTQIIESLLPDHDEALSMQEAADSHTGFYIQTGFVGGHPVFQLAIPTSDGYGVVSENQTLYPWRLYGVSWVAYKRIPVDAMERRISRRSRR